MSGDVRVATAQRHGGLLAPLAEIDGNLSLIECECMAQVALTGAHITGAGHLLATVIGIERIVVPRGGEHCFGVRLP
jgi:hypothetical protein